MGIGSSKPAATIKGTVTSGHLVAFTAVPGEIEDSGISTVSGSGNVTSTGALGSEPGSPSTGDLYFPNNGSVIERYSGSAWTPWGPNFEFTDPSAAGLSTWVNQGGASVDTTNGGIYLTAPATASLNFRMRVKTAPATPYTITAAFLPAITGVGTMGCGLAFRQSSDGKIISYQIDCTTTAQNMAVVKLTNATTVSAAYSVSTRYAPLPIVWMRIADSGVNRICSWSVDGQHWIQFHSVGRTDFLTADQVGIFANTQTASSDAGILLLSWKEA